MASSVVLVQGISVGISTAFIDDVTPSPLPVMVLLDCIGREISYEGGTADEVDVTTLCSTAKEFRLGLQDAGTMSVTGHWVQSHPAHAAIRVAANDKKTRYIQVTFSDASKFSALALVSQRSWSAAVNGVVTATYNFRLTGATVETP